MGRKPRIEFKGGVYHVIQRGNNREYIFKHKENKSYLVELLKEYKKIMNYHIYGFVFMDNHYHVIIRTLDARLQEIMHRVNNKYSKYYNYKNKRTGHVFEKRYKGILVKDEKYLLSLLRYIHQNPVRAKMCKRVKDYRWSSDSYYRKNKQNEIVDIDYILNIFSNKRNEAIKYYIRFMDADEMEEGEVFEEVSSIGENKSINIDEIIQSIHKKSLNEILLGVTQNQTIYDDIKRGSRKRNLTNFKKKYIEQALDSNYTMKEIGENILVSEAAIYKMINK